MRGEERLATFNDGAAVGLECVGGVVKRIAEEHADEEIGDAIEAQFEPRVIDDAAALHEARAENCVPAFVQHIPIADDVAAIVGFIGHHDHGGVAFHLVQTCDDGAAEAVWWAVPDQACFRDTLAERRHNGCGAIGAAVVNDDDFVRDIVEAQLEMKMLDGGLDATLFIACRNYNGQELER